MNGLKNVFKLQVICNSKINIIFREQYKQCIPGNWLHRYMCADRSM